MRITINDKERKVTAEMLDAVLVECAYESSHIATAVNGVFVHKHLRAQTKLNEGDSVEVVAPIEGG